MNTKLTLRMDHELIESAKIHAAGLGKSLSQMVADYFYMLDKKSIKEPVELPPITASLKGVLKTSDSKDVDEADYYAYLEKKYL